MFVFGLDKGYSKPGQSTSYNSSHEKEKSQPHDGFWA
jgi:hypothetical protein